MAHMGGLKIKVWQAVAVKHGDDRLHEGLKCFEKLTDKDAGFVCPAHGVLLEALHIFLGDKSVKAQAIGCSKTL